MVLVSEHLGVGFDQVESVVGAVDHLAILDPHEPGVVEVAEHALALLLALSRKVAFYHYETKSGRYQLQSGPTLRRIEGQTLGIVGLLIGVLMGSVHLASGMFIHEASVLLVILNAMRLLRFNRRKPAGPKPWKYQMPGGKVEGYS